mgnify:CR=1 FL=1
MLYLRARYYDATLGRFSQEDPIRADGHYYSYCGYDSVNRIDPLGLDWWHWAIAAAVVVGCTIAFVATCGGFAAAATAVAVVAGGSAVGSIGATVAAGALIGSSAALAGSAIVVASQSNTIEE